jgi:competence protein ComEC
LIGVSRGAVYRAHLAEFDGLYGQTVILEVRVSTDAVYGSHSQLKFDAADLRLSSGKTLTGRVQISGFGEPAVFQGDQLEAQGKLYPGFGQYQARMSYAKLSVVAHHDSLVDEIRRRFAAGVESALPEPQASFALGILIGQRATLSDEVKQDLLMVGLTHIIAVSGYNLTILLRASQRLLGTWSKRLSTLLAFGLIGIFMLLTGSSASIVRAGLISFLALWAAYYGRRFNPLNLICLAAAATAWANPYYIWSDMGWWLSFLAFFGVMIIAPLLLQRAPKRLNSSMIFIIMTESLSAELMTLPLVLHVFGQMSYIGLIANVLIAALVPFAMLFSTAAGLAGMLVTAWCGWLAWPARFILGYMLETARYLASLPHVFAEHIGLGWVSTLLLYGLVGVLTAATWFKSKAKSAIITDKNETNVEGAMT